MEVLDQDDETHWDYNGDDDVDDYSDDDDRSQIATVAKCIAAALRGQLAP